MSIIFSKNSSSVCAGEYLAAVSGSLWSVSGYKRLYVQSGTVLTLWTETLRWWARGRRRAEAGRGADMGEGADVGEGARERGGEGGQGGKAQSGGRASKIRQNGPNPVQASVDGERYVNKYTIKAHSW